MSQKFSPDGKLLKIERGSEKRYVPVVRRQLCHRVFRRAADALEYRERARLRWNALEVAQQGLRSDG